MRVVVFGQAMFKMVVGMQCESMCVCLFAVRPCGDAGIRVCVCECVYGCLCSVPKEEQKTLGLAKMVSSYCSGVSSATAR